MERRLLSPASAAEGRALFGATGCGGGEWAFVAGLRQEKQTWKCMFFPLQIGLSLILQCRCSLDVVAGQFGNRVVGVYQLFAGGQAQS